MAAVNEEISGDTRSSVFTPTDAVSEVTIEGNGGGNVTLMSKVPSGKWIAVTNQTGTFSVNTPDAAVTYSFLPENVTTATRVYMGP